MPYWLNFVKIIVITHNKFLLKSSKNSTQKVELQTQPLVFICCLANNWYSAFPKIEHNLCIGTVKQGDFDPKSMILLNYLLEGCALSNNHRKLDFDHLTYHTNIVLYFIAGGNKQSGNYHANFKTAT